MGKTLAVIGSGDLGVQIAHLALADGHYASVVFIDDFAPKTKKNGIPIIGKTADVLKLFGENAFDELLIGIGYKHLSKRVELFDVFNGAVPFGKLIHSTSWVDPTAQVKPGSVIYPNCSIDFRAVISENTIINNGCTIAHDTTIGKHCFLSPRIAAAGFITVGEQCILGINATIIDNIKIAAHTQLGAGTVVIKNIEKSGLYVGNPHKFVR